MGGTETFLSGMLVAVGVAALLVIASGLLFYGWRLYRLFTSLATGLVAAFAGWCFISPHLPAQAAAVAPLALGIGGVAAAIPLQRLAALVAMGAIGALTALLIGHSLYGVPLDFAERQAQLVGGCGFLGVGLCAAIFLRFFVVFFTSAYGGLVAIASVSLMLYSVTKSTPPVDVMTICVFSGAWSALTLIGMYYQYKLIKKDAKEKESKK